ncbi:programmed cell death protein 2-like [Histomonas meleagridis]|uniref:programmed cell death protein 2-like n=1 Tax=Histomonas meleagridis TaxID=135588 RepID=UPI00355AB840|nr:programmed cell death protein 2-like [Histomonas meleagridis]KAH0796786.1 programmed cell death protein 2-like [Histomonas meleagridis]
MSGSYVTLGVPEDPVYVPAEEGVTKIGGVPKWLCGEPKDFNQVKCTKCKCNLALILSCDCPTNDDFDRIIYLFVCPKCGKEARVFRQVKSISAPPETPQAPQTNQNTPLFGSSDLSNQSSSPDDLLAALSSFTTPPTNKKQPPPKKGKKSNRPQKEIGRFPAYYIETFDEPEALLEKGIQFTISSSVDSTASTINEEDLPDFEITPELVEYNERMSRCPEQVIRYSRFGTPLLPEKVDINVPRCSKCGAERVFELELMPTIIYKLDPNSPMDFGPILVYTCGADCGDGSCEEYCFVTPPI